MENKFRRSPKFFSSASCFIICLLLLNSSLYGQEVDLDSSVRIFLNRISEITHGRIYGENNRDKILKWRDAFLSKTMDYSKPIVVMVYPRFDYNDAFTYNSIAEIINAGNQLLYFEAGYLSELNGILESMIIKLPENQKISLIIGAHGTRNGMRFGRDIFDAGDNSVESKINHFHFHRLLRSLNIITLVLESCSTGEGEISRHNVANSFAEHISGMIYAPVIPVSALSIKYYFKEDGSIDKVLFGRGIFDTYSIMGNYVRTEARK